MYKSYFPSSRVVLALEVKVKFFAMLREIAGKKAEEITLQAKSSVGDLINFLVERYGPEFERYIYNSEKYARNYLSYMLNGVNINRLDGFNTILKNGDVLALLPPIGGG